MKALIIDLSETWKWDKIKVIMYIMRKQKNYHYLNKSLIQLMMICSIRLLNRLSRVRLSEQTGPVVRWPNWCWNWSVMPFFIVLSLHESTLSKCASKSLISFKLQVKRTHTVYILTQSQSLIGIDIIWSKKVWE